MLIKSINSDYDHKKGRQTAFTIPSWILNLLFNYRIEYYIWDRSKGSIHRIYSITSHKHAWNHKMEFKKVNIHESYSFVLLNEHSYIQFIFGSLFQTVGSRFASHFPICSLYSMLSIHLSSHWYAFSFCSPQTIHLIRMISSGINTNSK